MTDRSLSSNTRLADNPLSSGTGQKTAVFVYRHWLGLFLLGYGVFVALPFLAPIFKLLGMDTAAGVLYTVYSFLCHQLPERSFFFFGEKATYSLVEIQAAWQNSNNPQILRKFIGNPEMGWKVAWSDRMVSLYTSVWIAAAAWRLMCKRIQPLGWRGFLLLSLPMVIDGFSHMISDLTGIGLGFRDSNLWLALLTGNVFPAWFYGGDAWGSFNSIMRLLTGFLFGLGVVWFSFPILDPAFIDRDYLIGETKNEPSKYENRDGPAGR